MRIDINEDNEFLSHQSMKILYHPIAPRVSVLVFAL